MFSIVSTFQGRPQAIGIDAPDVMLDRPHLSDEQLRWLVVVGGIASAAIAGFAVAMFDLDAMIVSFSLFACILSLLDFRIGVMLLIVMMPLSASYWFPHSLAGVTGFNPMNLVLAVSFGSLIFSRMPMQRMARFPGKPMLWFYVLPMLIAGIMGTGHVEEIPSYFHALSLVEFNTAWEYFRDMLLKPMQMLLFAWLVAAAAARTPKLHNFLIPVLVAIWLMSMMAIAFVYLSGASLSELSSSGARQFFSPLGMHANSLGRLYAIAYALMLFTCVKTQSQQLRLALIASMVVLVIALVLTFSRGAFVGFAVVNLLFLASRRQMSTLAIGVIFIVALVALLPAAVYERLGVGWDTGLNAISAGRVDEIWLPLLPELLDSPIYGKGLGAILWSDAMRSGNILEVTHPHNAYLEAALDMGFVGLVLLCIYLGQVWKNFRILSKDTTLSPERRGFYEGAAVGLVSFLLTGFAGSSLLPVPEQSFLWLAIGMMYGETVQKRGRTC